ncbi:MAG: hypothetical protein DRJ09_02010 [Bacteroidetes bacterium]|nr:MAG: hypothetical protein DRJ09_02010 [Bacteroidota bacterium]
MKEIFLFMKILIFGRRFSLVMLLLYMFLYIPMSIYGQALQGERVLSFGGSRSDGGRSVCVDAASNVYITGYFQDTASFNDVKLISNGDTDIFLAKLDKYGDLLWVKQFGSDLRQNLILTEMGNIVKIDKKGNIYLSGIFSRSAVFGDTTLVSYGGDDIFVVKLNEKGEVIWANNYGSIGHDIVYDMTFDNNNNLILCGNLGTAPSGIAFKSTKMSSYAFLAKINTKGNLRLLRSVSAQGYAEANSVAVDNVNSIYWGINFKGNLILGDRKFLSKGKFDIFLEKIDTTDNPQWYKQIGGVADDKVSSLTIANNNNLILTGSFEDKLEINSKVLVSQGASDFLFCEFDKSGKIVWLERFGGLLSDQGISASSLSNGNLLIGGIFQGVVASSVDTIISMGFYDIVLLNYNKNRQLIGEKQIGNEYGDFIRSLVSDSDNAYFTGRYRGDIVVNNNEIYSKGSDDVFFASLPLSLLNSGGFSSVNLLANTDNNSINISPNPSTGNFFITSSNDPITVNITVKNISNKELMFLRNQTLPTQLNLSSLSNGTYFIYISYDSKRFIKKVIILN